MPFSHQMIGQVMVVYWSERMELADLALLEEAFEAEQQKSSAPLVYLGINRISTSPSKEARQKIVAMVESFYDRLSAGYLVPLGKPIRAAIMRSVFATMLLLSPRFGRKFYVCATPKEALEKAKTYLGISVEEALQRVPSEWRG